MDEFLLPEVGSEVVVVLPHDVAGSGLHKGKVERRVGRLITLRFERDGWRLESGAPGVVEYVTKRGRSIVEALAAKSMGRSAEFMLFPEHRRHDRFGFEWPVAVEAVGALSGPQHGLSEDVSLGGMRIRHPVELRDDQRAFVTIATEGLEPIRALARVLACSPAIGEGYHTRLSFTLMAAQDEIRLFELLRATRPANASPGKSSIEHVANNAA